ncbi:MAG: branched-chain amino acid ABC transporter permease [Burkholderiales bacterium]
MSDEGRDPRTTTRHAAPVLAAAIACALFPLVGGRFAVDLATSIMVYAIFALSLELLAGETGLVSFGHAAFLGIGAYATVLLAPKSGAPSLAWLAPLVVLVTAIAAAAIGALALRTRGVYFIMVTLAFSQMAYYVFHDTAIGGGSDGIYLNAKPTLPLVASLGDARTFYYVTFAVLALVFVALAAIKRSHFGHALAGIRVNETRMRAAGFPTYAYKLGAFTIAGALAGIAGLLWAVKDGFVNPELLAWHQSGTVLLMLILGGTGSLRGAALGALAFIVLKETFQSEALFGAFARHWQLPLGIAIIVLVATMPRGLMGIRAPWRTRARRAAAP